MKKLVLLILASLGLASCSHQPPAVYRFERPLMHTRWDFSVVASSKEEAERAVDLAAKEVARLDEILAMWKPESQVAKFNAQAGQGAQKLPAELDELLPLALSIGKKSDGAFDISVGPLVRLWYDSLKQGQLPADRAVLAAKLKMGYKNLKTDATGAWSLPLGFQIDLGGAAKGYAQDKAAMILRKAGIKDFLMNAGGQVYAMGTKPGGIKWKIGILNPRNPQKIVASLELKDQCMSTSGDYEQFTYIKGKRYHHILDPRTGFPTAHGMASATVILKMDQNALPGALADCLSTASFVLGPGKGVKFLESLGVSGVMIDESGDGNLKQELTSDLQGKVDLEFTLE